MSRQRKRALVGVVVLFAAAQFVGPEHANPPTDPGRAIQAHVADGSGLPAVLDRACRDCHSNNTVWRAYTRVAPAAGLMAEGVSEGRQAGHFSERGVCAPGGAR